MSTASAVPAGSAGGIAPIVLRVEVKPVPARAFALFTSHMGKWWPRGRTPAPNPHADILIEPHAGGRWFERDAQGNENQWGKVLAWEPPARVLLGWQLNTEWRYDPEFVTEVELRFDALEGGGTRVTLEHRNLERFGKDAVAHTAKISTGWPAMLGIFAQFADTHPT